MGKTTTAINLAVLLARRGRRVLAVDIDPQFALTRRLGIARRELPSTIVDVLAGWIAPGRGQSWPACMESMCCRARAS